MRRFRELVEVHLLNSYPERGSVLRTIRHRAFVFLANLPIHGALPPSRLWNSRKEWYPLALQ